MAAAAVIAAAIGAAPASAATPTPAKTFVDSVGVNVHTPYDQTSYQYLDFMRSALADLGIKHVRDNLSPWMGTQQAEYGKLADLGIGVTALTGNPKDSRTPAEYVSKVASDPNYRRAIEAFEGTNEWDYFFKFPYAPGVDGAAAGDVDSSWAAQAAKHQDSLVKAVAGSPDATVRSRPVHSPTLAFPLRTDAAGRTRVTRLREAAASGGYRLTSTSGQIAGHFYPADFKPLNDAGGQTLHELSQLVPNKGIQLTETGYTDAINASVGNSPVGQSEVATYIGRMLLEYSAIPEIKRTFLYELFDEHADPARSNTEDNFGLIEADGQAKPSYRMVRNILRLTEDDGKGGVAPSDRAYSVVASGKTDATDDVSHRLIQKSNGQYVLFVWRDVSVWKPYGARAHQDVPSVKVDFNLGAPGARLYTPGSQCQKLATVSASSISLSVSDQIFAFVLNGSEAADLKRGC